MNVNYEVLFWVMLGLVVFCWITILKLVALINNLKDDIGKLHARVNDVYYNTVDINANVGKVLDKVGVTKDLIEDIWSDGEEGCDFPNPDDEDEEWTPEPDENDEDPIRLIAPNDFFFKGPNDKFELDYLADRDELRYYYCGAEFIVIDNVAECIGEGLKFFGVNSKDPDVAYVRNDIFGADFRIVKRSSNDEC